MIRTQQSAVPIASRGAYQFKKGFLARHKQIFYRWREQSAILLCREAKSQICRYSTTDYFHFLINVKNIENYER